MADINTLIPSVDSIRSGAMDIAQYVLWGLLILGVGFYIWKKYQDKKIYIYPVRIFRQRHQGMVKEINTFGGYIKKGQLTEFSIKIGRMKKKSASKLPDSEYMDEDNRVYYWQVSPEAPLIQVKRNFVIESVLIPNTDYIEPSDQAKLEIVNQYLAKMETNEDYKELNPEEKKHIAIQLTEDYFNDEKIKQIDITKPTYSPVPTDLKQQALLDINNYKNTLGVDVNKQFAYFIAGVIALVIIGIVIFYIAVNQGDIPILTK